MSVTSDQPVSTGNIAAIVPLFGGAETVWTGSATNADVPGMGSYAALMVSVDVTDRGTVRDTSVMVPAAEGSRTVVLLNSSGLGVTVSATSTGVSLSGAEAASPKLSRVIGFRAGGGAAPS